MNIDFSVALICRFMRDNVNYKQFAIGRSTVTATSQISCLDIIKNVPRIEITSKEPSKKARTFA